MDLNKKRKIVEDDKKKLEDVIKELDEQKNVALKAAWIKVNKVRPVSFIDLLLSELRTFGYSLLWTSIY